MKQTNKQTKKINANKGTSKSVLNVKQQMQWEELEVSGSDDKPQIMEG